MSGFNPWIRGPLTDWNNVAITGGSIGSAVTGVVTPVAQSWVAVAGAADTNENILGTITIPANPGINASVRVRCIFTYTNSANNKTLRARYSGIGGTVLFGPTRTTQATSEFIFEMSFRGLTNSQTTFVKEISAGSLSVAGPTATAVDQTAATTIVLTGTKASAGETLTLEGYTAELIKP